MHHEAAWWKPGLPHKELMLLKKEIQTLYPNYWNCPIVFDEKWGKCCKQISQACNRIRAKSRKKGLSVNNDLNTVLIIVSLNLM